MSAIKIEEDLQELPMINGDAAQLKQVFLNVILNAIEAMQGERKILTIRSTRVDKEHMVAVEISDTGSGIPPEHMSQIFDPFFTTKRKGTGLGLSVVYGIINKHHGEIHVQSKPGEGTTVRIELPTIENVAQNGAREAEFAAPRGRIWPS